MTQMHPAILDNIMNGRPITGLYASKVEGTAPVTLRGLVEAAIAASEALSWASDGAISDAQYLAADRRDFDARKALIDHLFEVHGITRAMARQLGGIL